MKYLNLRMNSLETWRHGFLDIHVLGPVEVGFIHRSQLSEGNQFIIKYLNAVSI